jgi:hypothetical protein
MSCGKDDDSSDPDNPPVVNPDTPVPDPEGTITVNIDGRSSTKVIISGFGYINWDEPDNFELYADSYVSICNLGAMKGLGNITSIPSIGFTIPSRRNSTVACEAGHGYVVKFEERDATGEVIKVVYIRLYVVEPIVSTLGGIMGAKVKYQYPFEPAN